MLRQHKGTVLLPKAQVETNQKHQEILFSFVSFNIFIKKKLGINIPQETPPVFLKGLSKSSHESNWWEQNE